MYYINLYKNIYIYNNYIYIYIYIYIYVYIYIYIYNGHSGQRIHV